MQPQLAVKLCPQELVFSHSPFPGGSTWCMTKDLIFVLHLYKDPGSAYVNNFASSAGDAHQVYVIYDQTPSRRFQIQNICLGKGNMELRVNSVRRPMTGVLRSRCASIAKSSMTTMLSATIVDHWIVGLLSVPA
jgi:hypothetical protein